MRDTWRVAWDVPEDALMGVLGVFHGAGVEEIAVGSLAAFVGGWYALHGAAHLIELVVAMYDEYQSEPTGKRRSKD